MKLFGAGTLRGVPPIRALAAAAAAAALSGAATAGDGAAITIAQMTDETAPVSTAPAPRGEDVAGDIFIFAGWKVFHQNCHGCHGTDATGTDIAPSLVERIGSLTPEQFATKVLTRYRIVVPAGEAAGDDRTAFREAMLQEVRKHERGKAGELVMPAWESRNPDIKPHIVDLYDYLKARADGRLGPGRPPG